MGAFDKYVEILCYFGSFFNVLVSFGSFFRAFLTNFEITQNFLCYFLCYFLKNSEFGRTPEFREQVTALVPTASRISPFGAYRISHIASRVRLGLGDLSTFNIDLQYQLPNIDGDIYRGYIFDLEHPYSDHMTRSRPLIGPPSLPPLETWKLGDSETW